jgi:hypothetical protein
MIGTEELYDLYFSRNIRVIKLRRVRWTGMWNVWARGEVPAGFWWENLKERDYLEDLVLDEKVILKWIFNNWNGEAWT